MSNTTLNWEMRHLMEPMRADGRLSVWLCYVLHTNIRNRAWPSVETIMRETGWSRASVCAAKKWLEENGALENVPYGKRVGEECAIHQRQEIMQVTGVIVLDGIQYDMLYFNSLPSEILPSKSLPTETEGITSSKGITNNNSAGLVGAFEEMAEILREGGVDLTTFGDDILSGMERLEGSEEPENISAPPPPPKAPRPRNLLFDKVAEKSFGVSDTSKLPKSAAGWISGIVADLKTLDEEVTPEKLDRFYEWDKKAYPECTAVKERAKFSLHYAAFLYNPHRFDVVRTNQQPTPDNPRPPQHYE